MPESARGGAQASGETAAAIWGCRRKQIQRVSRPLVKRVQIASLSLLLGPAAFAAVAAWPLPSLGGPAKLVLAVAVWMAIWWVTEAVPLAVASLLPVVLFPLLDIRGVREVTPNYTNHMVFLFLGGFVLAHAVERSGLHRRLALAALAAMGGSARRQVWAFLVTTALLSMWLSNTATTLMMLPIALGVAERLDQPRAAVRVLLAIAFGASIGGVGTLVGTPPNLVLAGMAPRLVPDLPPIGFGDWMLFGLPVVAVLLPLAGCLLVRGLARDAGSLEAVAEARRALGPMTTRERRVAALFAATATAWVTRSRLHLGIVEIPGWSSLLPDPKLVSDAVPAIAATILATVVRASPGSKEPLVSWNEAQRSLPWGILLLFGGGFALADGVHAAGLDGWLAARLSALQSVPLPAALLAVVAMTAVVTNLTSNTATATLLLPVMAALAKVLHAPPYLLMGATTVAASCAFVLPVATPPNAIVIGSERVSVRDLFREGLLLNTIAVFAVTALVLGIGPYVLPAP
ncbi:MAG: SLC13/DASS family transporter [Candidatus Dadabacteria bacterium]|nr:MAG: SLC13/DASS family transporter [Candidatus Dadabacteria bacterium]